MTQDKKTSLAVANLERSLAGLKPLKNTEELKEWSKRHFRRGKK